MLELKPLSKEAIPGALDRAVRYRLLNDPWQAESICHDILKAEPDNQKAMLTIILSITDQFGTRLGANPSKALEMVSQLKDEYQRDYYKGIVYERQATAALKRDNPRSEYIAYGYLREAMECYERAEKSHATENEESILRYNACVRMINQHKLKPAPDEEGLQPFLDV